MNELNKRKKEFLKAYNNLCSCYGDIISEQTKVSCNILAEKVKLQQQLAIAVEALKYYEDKDNYDRHHQVVNGSNEWDSNVMIDNGKTAEQALQQIKELGK